MKKIRRYIALALMAFTGIMFTGCADVVDNSIWHVWSLTIVDGEGQSLNRATIPVGETLQLSAVMTPSFMNSDSYAWSSEDETIATVDQDGLVTALRSGRVNIVVKSVFYEASDKLVLTVAGGTVKISKAKVDQKDAD